VAVSTRPDPSAVKLAFDRRTLPIRSTVVAVTVTRDPGLTPPTRRAKGSSSGVSRGSTVSTAEAAL
jgi:hypothetical protein